MSIIDLLQELREKNIQVWVEEDKLRYRTLAGDFPVDLRAKVLERKAELVGILRQSQTRNDSQIVTLFLRK